MTDLHEPVRWLEDPDAGAALRADLAHGASATAGGLDYGVTLTALRGAIAAQTAPLASTAASSSGVSLGVKVAIGVLLAGGIAVWASQRDDGPVAPRAAAPTIARTQLEPEADAPAVREANVGAPTPVVPSVAPAPVAAEPEADAAIEIPEPPADPRTDRTKSRRRTDGATVDPRPSAPTTADDADRYVREAKLVAQARRALADDPGRALALTQQVEREFPNGLLEEERRALEIRALAGLGRGSEAKSAAKGFLAKFPDGPHAAAVRRAIEVDDTAP